MDGLLRFCIEVTNLSGHIVNPQAIHQAENRTVEPSQQAGNGTRACLACIFSQGDIAPPVESIFDLLVMPHQLQHSLRRGLAHRKTTESIHDLEADLPSFEDTGGAFESKDLLNASPLFLKPVIEIRATGDLSMFQSPMAFVPRLRLHPASTIRSAVCKQVGNIFQEGGLVVLGDEHIRSPTPMHLRAQLPLGMHRIQGHHPSFDQGWSNERLERADLILLLADIALPQHGPGGHIRATELMHRMSLRAGSSQGFPINGELSVIERALVRLCADWVRFHSEASLPSE